jgi:hypothetical protein
MLARSFSIEGGNERTTKAGGVCPALVVRRMCKSLPENCGFLMHQKSQKNLAIDQKQVASSVPGLVVLASTRQPTQVNTTALCYGHGPQRRQVVLRPRCTTSSRVEIEEPPAMASPSSVINLALVLFRSLVGPRVNGKLPSRLA